MSVRIFIPLQGSVGYPAENINLFNVFVVKLLIVYARAKHRPDNKQS